MAGTHVAAHLGDSDLGAMLMTVFVTLHELTQVIGKEELKYMFFGHRNKLANQERFRDAA